MFGIWSLYGIDGLHHAKRQYGVVGPRKPPAGFSDPVGEQPIEESRSGVSHGRRMFGDLTINTATNDPRRAELAEAHSEVPLDIFAQQKDPDETDLHTMTD